MRPASVLAALGVVLSAHVTLAQNSARIAGRVISKETRAPVAAVDVDLAPGARRVTSDAAGAFRFDSVAPGNVTLIVKRIGFVPESLYVTLQPNEDLDLVVELRQAVQTLDTVNVAARAAPLATGKLSGFDQRRQFGIGRFIDSAVFEKEQHRQLGELITSRTPGTRLVRARGASAAWISTTRGSGSLRGAALDAMDLRKGADPRACYPDVYLDGAVVYSISTGGPLFDFNSMTAGQVAAVEVYVGPSQTPIQYNKVGSVCGVVLIWTK